MQKYTKEQMFQKLEKADAAGDVEAAKFFASEIRRMDSEGGVSAPPEQDMETQVRMAQSDAMSGKRTGLDMVAEERGAKYREENPNLRSLDDFTDNEIGRKNILIEAGALAPQLLSFLGGGLVGRAVTGGLAGAGSEAIREYGYADAYGKYADDEKIAQNAMVDGALNAFVPVAFRGLANGARAVGIGGKQSLEAFADSIGRKADDPRNVPVAANLKYASKQTGVYPTLTQMTDNKLLQSIDKISSTSWFRGNAVDDRSKQFADALGGYVRMTTGDSKLAKEVSEELVGGRGKVNQTANAIAEAALAFTTGGTGNVIKNTTAESTAELSKRLPKILMDNMLQRPARDSSGRLILDANGNGQASTVDIGRSWKRNANSRLRDGVADENGRAKLMKRTAEQLDKLSKNKYARTGLVAADDLNSFADGFQRFFQPQE